MSDTSKQVSPDSYNTKIAICFFGISRSLHYTIESIIQNIINPSQKLGDVEIFAHFFNQGHVANKRSGENSTFDVQEYELLRPDWVTIEEPDSCLGLYNFETLKLYGDSWGDNFMSLRNLIHQLHSLNEVTQAASLWGADVVIFARPDLIYHSSLEAEITRAVRNRKEGVIIPAWQNWEGGYNDRFSICVGPKAVRAYGERISLAHSFCANFQNGLHSERLLRFALQSEGISPKWTRARASRVRVGGHVKVEKFHGRIVTGLFDLKRKISNKIILRMLK